MNDAQLPRKLRFKKVWAGLPLTGKLFPKTNFLVELYHPKSFFFFKILLPPSFFFTFNTKHRQILMTGWFHVLKISDAISNCVYRQNRLWRSSCQLRLILIYSTSHLSITGTQLLFENLKKTLGRYKSELHIFHLDCFQKKRN